MTTKAEVERLALELPDNERIEVAERILCSVANPPLPEWHREELERRLARLDEESTHTWDEVKEALWPPGE